MSIIRPGSKSTNTPSPDSAGPSASFPASSPIGQRHYRRVRGLPAILMSFRSAVQALRANILRSLLTSLGIIIGVGAVIMMISISEGNSASINQRLSTLNPLQLTIRPGSARSAGNVRQGGGTLQSLTQADADAIAQQPGVTAASPVINANGQIIFSNQNWQTSIQGVYPDYQQIGSWTMQEGSFISDSDEQSGKNVAVLGQPVAHNLFSAGTDPVCQQVRIRNVPVSGAGTR